MSAHNLTLALSAVSFFNAEPNLEGCSSTDLNQPCQSEVAVVQSDCLQGRIDKFYQCNQKVDEYERKLQKIIEETVAEKGRVVVDSLKTESANHFQRMKTLASILEWHDKNLQRLSNEFALWVKSFERSYRATEIESKNQIKKLWDAAEQVEDYLDFINLRFDLKSLLSREQSLSHEYKNKSVRFLSQFGDVSSFVHDELLMQKSYMEDQKIENLLPHFENELEFARSVAIYAQRRKELVERESRKLLGHIELRMRELKEEKLRQDKERDFREAHFIEREVGFHQQIVDLAQNAFAPSGGDEAVQELLTLESICSEENLLKPENSWMQWGCGQLAKLHKALQNQLRRAENIQ